MRRASLVIALICALLGASARTAWASGMWLSTNGFAPNELRVAIAASEGRTTVWTSLAFDSRRTTLALVLPVPAGTMVDLSPDAWFDALDTATAPRIYTSPELFCPDGTPPPGVDPTCVASGSLTSPVPSLPATGLEMLDGPAAVRAWANDHDMAIPSSVAPALDVLIGSQFVAVRFVVPPPGGGVTQTVRLVMPGAPPELALSLFDIEDRDPMVTTYLIGRGLGALRGTSPVFLDPTQIVPDCDGYNYVGALGQLLYAPGTSLVQCAGRSLWTSPANPDPAAQFDSVLDAYFAEATAGVSGSPDPTACLATATSALASESPVAEACPAAAEGVVGEGAPCVEGGGTRLQGLVDPASLRCGAADDVAIAFSGLRPDEVWLTRETLYLTAPPDQPYPVTFGPGEEVTPVVYASGIEWGTCSSQDTGSDDTSSSSQDSQQSSGCNGDGADAAAEGCGAAAEGLGAIGDAGDCSAGRAHPRPSAWMPALALAALLAPLRRRARRRR